MNYTELKDVLLLAVSNCIKVHLQMNDTPDDKVILFWPHVLATDALSGSEECFGIMEAHYVPHGEPYNKTPAIKGMKSVTLSEEQFVPDLLLAREYAYNSKRPKDIILAVFGDDEDE